VTVLGERRAGKTLSAASLAQINMAIAALRDLIDSAEATSDGNDQDQDGDQAEAA
jgi:hypothetical protein